MATTLRETMREGKRGDFGQALLALVEEQRLGNLMAALRLADDDNAAAIERALPGAREIIRIVCRDWPGNWAVTLKQQFKALEHLDEESENSQRLDLKTGEPKARFAEPVLADAGVG